MTTPNGGKWRYFLRALITVNIIGISLLFGLPLLGLVTAGALGAAFFLVLVGLFVFLPIAVINIISLLFYLIKFRPQGTPRVMSYALLALIVGSLTYFVIIPFIELKISEIPISREEAAVLVNECRTRSIIRSDHNHGLTEIWLRKAAKYPRYVSLLTCKGDPWHRDGWMFQVMSWLAAHKAHPGGAIAPPHMIHAHKGFDGIQLEMDTISGLVTAVILFEDKATNNERGTVLQVFRNLKKLEAGHRQNVIAQEVTGLLSTLSGIDVDAAIANIIWAKVRHYRIAVTVGAKHADAAGRRNLFKGYAKAVPGPIERRRGETFEIENLRPWMASLAEKAIAAVKVMAVAHV